MNRTRAVRSPNGTPESPVRTFRVADEIWDRAKARAQQDGSTMSSILLAFVDGYGLGKINPPRMTVIYDTEPHQDRLTG